MVDSQPKAVRVGLLQLASFVGWLQLGECVVEGAGGLCFIMTAGLRQSLKGKVELLLCHDEQWLPLCCVLVLLCHAASAGGCIGAGALRHLSGIEKRL